MCRCGVLRPLMVQFSAGCEVRRAAIVFAMRLPFGPLHCSVIALLIASARAALGGEPAAALPTGIEGMISIGPIHGGPIRAGEADSAPLVKATFDVSSSGGIVASFETDDTGHFRLALAPGHYSIQRRGAKKKVGSCGPFEVEVPADSFKKIRWDCDTGMR